MSYSCGPGLMTKKQGSSQMTEPVKHAQKGKHPLKLIMIRALRLNYLQNVRVKMVPR